MFLDGVESVVLEQLGFDQCDGNALFLSNYARNNTVRDCDFYRTGDTAIAAIGSGNMMNGSTPTHPAFNMIVGNHIDFVGYYTKQVSCYCKAITYANTISNNVCHNGPRAGVNFNDGAPMCDVLFVTASIDCHALV